MGSHDAVELRKNAATLLPKRIINLIEKEFDEKDRRIDELLASNQQLRDRAQKAEARVRQMEAGDGVVGD